LTMAKVNIFRITGKDKRQDLIAAYDNETDFWAQKPSGADVAKFIPGIGFVLVEKGHNIRMKLQGTERARNMAEFTLGPSMALREIYYAMRNNPLAAPFSTASDLYKAILASINTMEIVCDINRSEFTFGNFPKGYIFYGHSWRYGNEQELIGMTENLARSVLDEYEISHAQSIVHLEKMSAASRLLEMGFSKLTNTLITTTGGNFTRAVYALANRFHKKKHTMFFVDGDVYGNDMLRTLEYGSMKSRHLTLDQAFPESSHPLIHIAGLFPSVAERLDIPNDLEEKRPLSNPQAKKRMEFLKRYNLIDNRDIATWERNKTFELESLSTNFTNSADEPVGLGIYLVEYMRLKGIPCKPQPPEDDMELLDDFGDLAKQHLISEIETKIEENAPIEKLKDMVAEKFNDVIEKIANEIYSNHTDEFIDEYVHRVTANDIREKVAEQYQTSPRREIYSLEEIAAEMINDFDITVEWNTVILEEKIEKAVKSYMDSLPKELSEIYEETIEFSDLPEPEEEIRDFYDVVEEELGADLEDCQAVREALEWRLS